MKFYLSGLITILVVGSAQASLEGNSADGKRLHDAKCVACHDTNVYTRKGRQIQSLEGLKQQMENCSHMARIELSEPEKRNIVKYLNDQFYRFH